MIPITVAMLLSMILAKPFENRRLVFAGKYRMISIKHDQYIYFLPTILLVVLNWGVKGMEMDTVYGWGSYYSLYRFYLEGGTLHRSLGEDPLSYGLLQLFAKANLPWVIYLSILKLIFIISYANFFKKECTYPAFGLFLFYAVGTATFGMAALRQMLSNVFLLYAYQIAFMDDKLDKSQWIKMIAALVLGGLCHFSCILMIPVFVFSRIRVNKDVAILILAAMTLLIRYLGNIVNFLLRLTRFSKVLSIGYDPDKFTLTFVLLSLFLLILTRVFYDGYARRNRTAGITFNFLLSFCLVMFLSGFMRDGYRLILLFTPVVISELPKVVHAIEKKFTRFMVTASCVLVFGVMYVANYYDFNYHTFLPMLPEVLTWR